jgi:NAD(P)-dependent dehydrogenase (short-subunit alcohol dehydrogenase family)
MEDRTHSLLKFAALALGGYVAARFAVAKARSISFKDRVVVITGGSRGLGLLLARRFGAEGAKLVIASREQVELDRALKELQQRGYNVVATHCDVRLKNDVENLIRTAVEHFGGVDVLINNAGVISVGPFELMTERDYEESIDTHFWGPLHAMRAVYPLMRARGGGRIVNISSIGGKIGVPHLAPYCAGKFALAGLSQASAAELRKDNIYVTTVYPALIRTGSPRNALFKGRNEEEFRWFVLGDSLPLVSQSADRAAARIICACRHGDAEAITSMPAALAARFHALCPWLSVEMSALANEFVLPEPGGIGAERVRGHESETPITQSALTALTRAAARRNNEELPIQ